MEQAIQVQNLSFSYSTRKVLHDTSFTIPKHGITSLIGPNGSGKSTILKILLGLYTQQAGTVIISPNPKTERNSIAYSPEVYALFKDSTVLEYLMLAGQLRGMKITESKNASKDFLHKIGLGKIKHTPVYSLSKGNSQKIQLVACLISQPKLAILDEPWSGLDPENQEKTTQLLVEASNAGATVLLTGHHMGMIERASKHIIAIQDGRVIASGTPEELLRKILPDKNLTLTYSTGTCRPQQFKDIPVVWDQQGLNAKLIIRTGMDIGIIISEARKYGNIVDINTSVGTLHDAYMSMYGDKTKYEDA